jgi:hypothetical protein
MTINLYFRTTTYIFIRILIFLMEIYIYTHEKDNKKSKIPKGTISIHNQKPNIQKAKYKYPK